MVAGDTRRVIVIKDISSNLIEEAILILRNEPAPKGNAHTGSSAAARANIKNDLILKEAESIINQYIRDNGLKCGSKKEWPRNIRPHRRTISRNVLINCLLITALAALIWVVSKIF